MTHAQRHPERSGHRCFPSKRSAPRCLRTGSWRGRRVSGSSCCATRSSRISSTTVRSEVDRSGARLGVLRLHAGRLQPRRQGPLADRQDHRGAARRHHPAAGNHRRALPDQRGQGDASPLSDAHRDSWRPTFADDVPPGQRSISAGSNSASARPRCDAASFSAGFNCAAVAAIGDRREGTRGRSRTRRHRAARGRSRRATRRAPQLRRHRRPARRPRRKPHRAARRAHRAAAPATTRCCRRRRRG